MTEVFTESEAIAAVGGLSHARLCAFIDAGLVVPQRAPEGPCFRSVDLARLALLCDLAEDFDLEGDALAVVIGLVDQLYLTRLHLHAMAQAVQAEPAELRSRVGARFISLLEV